MIFTLFGIIAAVLFIVADYFYLKDTVHGGTMPQRTSWWIAFILNVIAFANQLASGATSSLWVFGAGVIMVGAIAVASLRHGMGGYAKSDVVVLAIAGIGIVLWLTLDSPLYSILSLVVTSTAHRYLTVVKTIHYPKTELRLTWLLALFSNIFTIAAVGSLDATLYILPVTYALLNVPMVYLLYFRRTSEVS